LEGLSWESKLVVIHVDPHISNAATLQFHNEESPPKQIGNQFMMMMMMMMMTDIDRPI